MQLSVGRYQAISVDRGANLDTIDVPLNNRVWLAQRFAEIRKMSDESERLSELALDWSSAGDIATQSYARSARALALVARGANEEGRAEALAAVDLSAGSDFANQRGNASLDLAVVLRACGDELGARRAALQAQAYFASKGNVSAAERAAMLAAP